ncbi:MAG TPA: hypothetical protein VG479_05675 [Gaiellaceae bacterium]|nr:hypothetical protein [Gaiellaceae bacterium]
MPHGRRGDETTTPDLDTALRERGEGARKPRPGAGLAAGFGTARRRLTAFLGAVVALAFLRRAKPVRILVLSVSALAAGTLGLMMAYAISPDQGASAQVLVSNGTTYTVTTVTGPEGTRTVAVAKTKKGEVRVVPVRILDTVTGPGGVETVSVQALGPVRTVKDLETLTQILTQTSFLTQTDVLTQIDTQFQTVTLPPDTVTVTPPPDTVTVTPPPDTVTVTLPGDTVTVTVTEPPPPP